jgi:hypothetical protein
MFLLSAAAVLCVGVGVSPGAAQEPTPYDPTLIDGGDDGTWELRPTTCPTWTTEGFLGTPVYPFGGYLFVSAWTLEEKFEGKTEGYYHASPDPNPKDIFKRVRWQGARLYVTCRQWVWRDRWGYGRFGANVYDSIEGKEEGTIRPCSSGSDSLTLSPYDPYGPADDCADDTPIYPQPGGGGGGGDPGGGGGSGCRQEYIVIEISYDDGKTWHVYWEGNATICDGAP